tara:strand:+ start:1688 stop:2434 length:747 start_codon:yes stop_codon:yes gene_type:complete
MKRALIDAELYLFKAAAANEQWVEWDPQNAPDDYTYVCRHKDAKATFREVLAEISDKLINHQLLLCFGAGQSFRHGVYREYKANRRKKLRTMPAGYPKLKEWAIEEHASICLENVEGDDVLGLIACHQDVIVSQDKDLLTVPGLHLRGEEMVQVTKYAANLAFFKQCLVGDTSDNYPGLKGVGAVGAAKELANCNTEVEMWERIRTLYERKGFDEAFAISQARCARILRPGEYDLENRSPLLWMPPVS